MNLYVVNQRRIQGRDQKDFAIPLPIGLREKINKRGNKREKGEGNGKKEGSQSPGLASPPPNLISEDAHLL